MHLPPLRLIDDPDAKVDTERLLQLALSERHTPTGFEWPLVRSLMDARYCRPCDTAFLAGFVGATVMRWMRRSIVLAPRRWWVMPLYVGLVAREFALADSARRCHYTDFMVLTAGMDTPMGEMSRYLLDTWRGGVKNAYPQVTKFGVIPEPKASTKKPPVANPMSSLKKGAKPPLPAKPTSDGFWANMAIVFPNLSSDDLFSKPQMPKSFIYPMIALASRFVLLHSICDTFGGSSVLERHVVKEKGTKRVPLRDGARFVTPEARIEKIQSMATYLNDDNPAFTSKDGKSPPPAVCTDLFLLHISTRFFDWTPIEYSKCERGSNSAHMMSVSTPTIKPLDVFDNLMRNPEFRRWWEELPQPALSKLWWSWHFAMYR